MRNVEGGNRSAEDVNLREWEGKNEVLICGLRHLQLWNWNPFALSPVPYAHLLKSLHMNIDAMLSINNSPLRVSTQCPSLISIMLWFSSSAMGLLKVSAKFMPDLA